MSTFSLWLEFELWGDDHPFDQYNDYCNIEIAFQDGRRYGLNVWTFKYCDEAIREQIAQGGVNGLYVLPPDLLVKKLDRQVIEEVIAELVKNDLVRQEWLIRDR